MAVSAPPVLLYRYCGACDDAVSLLAPADVQQLRCPRCGHAEFLVRAGPDASQHARDAKRRAELLRKASLTTSPATAVAEDLGDTSS